MRILTVFNIYFFHLFQGPGYNGAGGVHTHMTNTRITDIEIVETRYPLLVTKFSLRDGSGGKGEAFII